MNKLTILLTLWDREEYTQTWFLNNYFHDVDYLIADGSFGDANELFFNKNKKNNIKYIRFPIDEDIESFHKKVWDSSKMIKTPYVMICDNDDFLNIDGIKKCVNFLEANEDYSFCGGRILEVEENFGNPINKKFLYKFKFGYTINNSNLDGLFGIDGIKSMFRPYRYLWYSVYRTDIFSNIWKGIYDTNLQNGKLTEMLQTQLAFYYGKYKDLNVNTYIRLGNPISSYDSIEASIVKGAWSHSRIYFDDDYRNEVIKMADLLSKLLKVPLEKITREYVQFYSFALSDKNNLPIKTRFYNKIMRLIFKISPKISIKQIIRFVNLLIR